MDKRTLREELIRSEDGVNLPPQDPGADTLVIRSELRDQFEASLPSVIRFLQEKGFQEEDVYRITAIVGELGNNTFDHNLGKWPNGFIGCFLALRVHKTEKLLEMVIVDLGVGFQESLKAHDPTPRSEQEAIIMGLKGATGRIGEKRGNGLRTIRAWMKLYYRGKLRIQSRNGVVEVENQAMHDYTSREISGSEVYLRLHYGDSSQ